MPATLTSFQPQSVYEYSGKNLAPKAELDTLAQNKPVTSPNSFTLAIQNKYKEYMERDDQVWREIYDTGQLVSNLTQGKMEVLRNPITRAYAFVKKDSRFADRATVGGTFQFYMTKLDAEWLMSKPEIDPVISSSNDQVEEFIDSVKVVQDYYSKKFYTTDFELAECDSAKCFGTYIARYRFDPHVSDLICELLPFPACRWDIRFIPEESSYFIYESKCSNAVLEQLLDADIAPDNGSNENYGLQIMEQIQKRGGNAMGTGKERPYGWSSNVEGENVVTEMWLKPEAYCDIDISVSERTLGGVTLKQGKTLMKTFPRGMCVVGINGMQTIIGLYDECHKDHIVSGMYHRQSYSGVGKGVSDAVDVQKDLDEFFSQRRAYIKVHSTPPTYYAQGMITEANMRNHAKPRAAIPVDFNNAPEGMKSINEAIQAVTPMNPAQAIWDIGTELKENLQLAFQVTNFSDGLPGVDNSTATGVREGQQLAQQMLVPQHLAKAENRVRASKVIINLFKKYWRDKEKWFATKDPNPITRGRYFNGEYFDQVEIDFEVVANSQIPKSPKAQEESLTRLLMASGGMLPFMQVAAQFPEVAGDMATAFGAKLSIPTKDDISRVCRRRVEQAKDLLEMELQNQQVMAASFQSFGMAMPPIDNTNLAAAIVSQIKPPISPKEQYGQQKAEWLAELLDSDEMNYTFPEMRYVVEQMIDVQLQLSTLGQGQIAQDQNIGTVMANLPMLVGEQMMTQGNQALQQQQAAEEAQAQQQQKLLEAGINLEARKAEAEIAETEAQAGHQRSLELADKSHASAMELQKAKPKTK